MKKIAMPATSFVPEDVVWTDIREEPFRIYGLPGTTEEDGFLRMPSAIAKTVSANVEKLNHDTSGGRIRFRTDSPYICVNVKSPVPDMLGHICLLGEAGADLYRGDGKEAFYAGSFVPGDYGGDFEAYLPLEEGLSTYTVNMPLYNPVRQMKIGIRKGSRLEEAPPYSCPKSILCYGSSITQGACASRPGNVYASMLSRRFDADFVNLGFSGSCCGEKTISDYLASCHPDIFVCDYDHNSPTPEHLESTLNYLFDTFRNENPATPVILVSRPNYRSYIEEDEVRRRIIRDVAERARKNGDENTAFVDGSKIMDGHFQDSCLVDLTHPNDLGFFRMAEHIGGAVEKFL